MVERQEQNLLYEYCLWYRLLLIRCRKVVGTIDFRHNSIAKGSSFVEFL